MKSDGGAAFVIENQPEKHSFFAHRAAEPQEKWGYSIPVQEQNVTGHVRNCMLERLWTVVFLAKMSGEILSYLWPVSLFLFASLFASFIYSKMRIRTVHYFLLAGLFLFPLSVLLIGGLFWHTGGRSDAPAWPLIVVETLFWTQLLVSILLIYRSKGSRWFAASFAAAAIWTNAICWFVAGMALTNVWL